MTASYWGICETMMHWMVYEYLKKRLAEYKARNSIGAGGNGGGGGGGGGLTGVDMFGLMGCGACSRLCATAIAYPHGGCGIIFESACYSLNSLMSSIKFCLLVHRFMTKLSLAFAHNRVGTCSIQLRLHEIYDLRLQVRSSREEMSKGRI